MALDPLPDELRSGRAVHRHCMLERGHEGLHRSKDMNGFTVHEWRWVDDIDERRLITQPGLFDMKGAADG